MKVEERTNDWNAKKQKKKYEFAEKIVEKEIQKCSFVPEFVSRANQVKKS